MALSCVHCINFFPFFLFSLENCPILGVEKSGWSPLSIARRNRVRHFSFYFSCRVFESPRLHVSLIIHITSNTVWYDRGDATDALPLLYVKNTSGPCCMVQNTRTRGHDAIVLSYISRAVRPNGHVALPVLYSAAHGPHS